METGHGLTDAHESQSLISPGSANAAPDGDQAPSVAENKELHAIQPQDLLLNSSDDTNTQAPDPLTFRPLVLRPWFLLLSLGFDLSIIILLILMCVHPLFYLLNDWAYFVVQILPTVIGTVTAMKLEAIVNSLSRITPFIRCAQPGGDLAATSIFLPYTPVLGMKASVRSRNWILFCGQLVVYLGYNILALKTTLLFASLDDRIADVNPFALYSLLAGYLVIALYTGWVAVYLHRRPTGLRQGWDTVNIADHLVLFRHSNFLDAFEGSGIATRASMMACLGNRRLKLGFWPLENISTRFQRASNDDAPPINASVDRLSAPESLGKLWYGFQDVGEDDKIRMSDSDALSRSCGRRQRRGRLTAQEFSRLRYRSGLGVMTSSSAIWYALMALICLVGYILAVCTGHPDKGVHYLPFLPDVTGLILGYVVTLIFTSFGVLWEDMYLLAAITEPFVEMNKLEGANADRALLLNYTSSHRFITMFTAASRGHWKILRTAVVATLHRFLPVTVGASIIIQPGYDDQHRLRTIIWFSTPLSIVVVIFMLGYLVLIPYEVFESGYSRHLPRACLTIADLLSWTCSSSLLRDDAVSLTADQQEAKLSPYNPLDTRGDEPHNQKWYMEARLRLAQQRFNMGLIRVATRQDVYTVGIDTSTAAILYRPSKGLRRRIAGIKERNNTIVDSEKVYEVAGAENLTGFVILDASKNKFLGLTIVGGLKTTFHGLAEIIARGSPC